MPSSTKAKDYPRVLIPIYGDQIARIVWNKRQENKVFTNLLKTNDHKEILVVDAICLDKPK